MPMAGLPFFGVECVTIDILQNLMTGQLFHPELQWMNHFYFYPFHQSQIVYKIEVI